MSKKLTFLNLAPGVFKCKENSRFHYTLERNQFDIKAVVFDGDRQITQFTTSFTDGWFILFVLGGREANMGIAFRKAHRLAVKAITNSIKNGC